MKNRASFWFVFLVLALAAMNAFGQEVSVEVGYHSQYLGNNGGVFHPDPVLQGNATLGWKHVYLDVWRSQTLKDGCRNFGCETDYTAGATFSVGKVDVDLSIAYFDIFHPGSARYADMIEPRLELSHMLDWGESGTLKRSLTFESYHAVRGSAPGSGQIVRATVERFKPGFINFDALVQLFYDTGAFDGDNGFFAHLGLEFSRDISDHASVYVGGRWYWPLTDVNDGREHADEYSGGTRFIF
jgi:hypothetical protein